MSKIASKRTKRWFHIHSIVGHRLSHIVSKKETIVFQLSVNHSCIYSFKSETRENSIGINDLIHKKMKNPKRVKFREGINCITATLFTEIHI